MNEAEKFLQQYQSEKRHIAVEESKITSAIADVDQMGSRKRYNDKTIKIGLLEDWWTIDGRLGRRLYIQRILCLWACLFIASLVVGVGANMKGRAHDSQQTALLLLFIAGTIILLPQHAKRFHDLGWSGWWQVLLHVPILGFVVSVILWCIKGTNGSNQYGSNVYNS